MRLILISAAGLVLAGCAQTVEEAAPVQEAAKRCDAETTGRELIGSHVGAIDFAPGANVRVVCTTCPTTKDLRPDRLNVRFDQATGIVRSVDCG